MYPISSSSRFETVSEIAVERSLRRRKHAETWHALEVGRVTSCDGQPVRNCRGSDPEVVRSDDDSAPGELRPDVCMGAGDRFGDRDRLQARLEVFDKGAAPSAARALRAVDPVEELTDGDDADGAILVAQQLVESSGAALEIDEEAGID